MIPKIIHYCWFGNNPKPVEVLSYISNWKKLLPDFQFMEWNEKNFNINYNVFSTEAYSVKKYAFVADVARLFALKQYGGVYFDTDVEVVKDFSKFLEAPAFLSFESNDRIGTAVMGSEPDSEFINNCLEYYENKHFILDGGKYNIIPNTTIIIDMLLKRNLVCNNTFQVLSNYLYVYPRTYFSAKIYETGELEITNDTYTVHHFAGSWHPWWKKVLLKFWLPFKTRFPKLASLLNKK